MTVMRDINMGRRIVSFDNELVTRLQIAHLLDDSQHRKGAEKTDGIEMLGSCHDNQA